MEVGQKHGNGHGYWKMKVSSIHEGQDGKVWIVGEWYYSPSNLNTVKLCKRCVSLLFSKLFDESMFQGPRADCFDGQHGAGCIRPPWSD
jgi:hypothetical protein